MSGLLGIHDVKKDGGSVGSLSITQSGLMTVFECECDFKSDGIMRLAGVSGSQYVKIGVMEPSGGVLKLRKSFSKSALASLKLEVESGFYLIMPDDTYSGGAEKNNRESVQEPEPVRTPEPVRAPEPASVTESTEVPKAEKPPDNPPPTVQDSEWSPIADPSVLFDDEDIANACRGAKGALVMKKDGITQLAIPVVPGEPFPMMPVFCFGDSEVLNGREHIIFKSENGKFIV